MSLYRSPLGSGGSAAVGSHLSAVPMSIEEEDALAFQFPAAANGIDANGARIDRRSVGDYAALNTMNAANAMNSASVSSASRSPSKRAPPPPPIVPSLAAQQSSRMQAIRRTGSLGAHDFLARLHQVHGERERRRADDAHDNGFSCAVCGVRHYRESGEPGAAADTSGAQPNQAAALQSRELPLLIEPFSSSTDRICQIGPRTLETAGVPMSLAFSAYNLSPRCCSPVNAGPMGGGGAFAPGFNSPNSCRSFDSAVAMGGEASPVHMAAGGGGGGQKPAMGAGISGAFLASRIKSPVCLQVPIASNYTGAAACTSPLGGGYMLEQETLYRRSMESVRVEHPETCARALDVSRLCRSYENAAASPTFPRADHHMLMPIIANSNETSAAAAYASANAAALCAPLNPAPRNPPVAHRLESGRDETLAAILQIGTPTTTAAAAPSSARRPHDFDTLADLQQQQQRPLRRAQSLLTRSAAGNNGAEAGGGGGGSRADRPRNVASMCRRQSWLRSMSAAKCSTPQEHEGQAPDAIATEGRTEQRNGGDRAAGDGDADADEKRVARCSKEADSGVSVALSGDERDRRGAHCSASFRVEFLNGAHCTVSVLVMYCTVLYE